MKRQDESMQEGKRTAVKMIMLCSNESPLNGLRCLGLKCQHDGTSNGGRFTAIKHQSLHEKSSELAEKT